MNADMKRAERRKALRAAKRPQHRDRYAAPAAEPRGVERDLQEALAALLEMYGPEVPR